MFGDLIWFKSEEIQSEREQLLIKSFEKLTESLHCLPSAQTELTFFYHTLFIILIWGYYLNFFHIMFMKSNLWHLPADHG